MSSVYELASQLACGHVATERPKMPRTLKCPNKRAEWFSERCIEFFLFGDGVTKVTCESLPVNQKGFDSLYIDSAKRRVVVVQTKNGWSDSSAVHAATVVKFIEDSIGTLSRVNFEGVPGDIRTKLNTSGAYELIFVVAARSYAKNLDAMLSKIRRECPLHTILAFKCDDTHPNVFRPADSHSWNFAFSNCARFDFYKLSRAFSDGPAPRGPAPERQAPVPRVPASEVRGLQHILLARCVQLSEQSPDGVFKKNRIRDASDADGAKMRDLLKATHGGCDRDLRDKGYISYVGDKRTHYTVTDEGRATHRRRLK